MKIKLRLFQIACFIGAICFIGMLICFLEGCATELPPPPHEEASDCIDDGDKVQCVDEGMSVWVKDQKADNLKFGDHSGD